MGTESVVRVMLNFSAPDLDADERDGEVQKFLSQVRQLDEILHSDRVLDPHPPEGNKALGGFLPGLLLMDVNAANVQKLFQFLGDRLSGKTIEMEVEANGKKLKVKASSQAELMAAITAAQQFVAL